MDEGWSPARPWLRKADNDLASAKVLAAVQPPLRDTAIYHCQQAGEKALKAALAWRKKPLQKTHDLETLLNLVVADYPALETLRNSAELLSPYAMDFRYPGDLFVPSAEETQKAFAAAEMIVLAIHRIIG
jgi:HEPN domain-containing protein